VVLELANNPLNAAIDDEHGAGAAGRHAAIQGAAFERDAQSGSLADGVLLGMDGSHAVVGYMAVGMRHLFEEMSYIVAVWQPHGRTHVSGYQYLLVAGNDAAAAPAIAGSALGHGARYFHEVLVPGGTDIRSAFLFVHNPAY